MLRSTVRMAARPVRGSIAQDSANGAAMRGYLYEADRAQKEHSMSRVHDTAWHSWLQPQGSQVVAHWLSGMFCSPSLSSLARAPGQQLISLRNFGGRQAQGDQPDAALARQHVPPPGLQNDFTDDGTAQGTQAQPPEIPSSSQALAGNRGSPQPAPEAVPAVRRLHQLSEEPQELQEDLRCRLQRMHEHLRRKEHRQALQAFNTSLPPRGQTREVTQLFDAALVAAAGLGNAALAQNLLRTMLAGSQRVGYVAYGCVVRALCHERGPQAALDFMGKDVPEAAQTGVMFNTVLSSCLAWREAGPVFERCLLRMEALGIEWDSWTWALAMRRQASCGDVQKVEGLWAAFKASELSLDTRKSIPAATGRIWALLQLDRLEAALQALQEVLAEWRSLTGEVGDTDAGLPDDSGLLKELESEFQTLQSIRQPVDWAQLDKSAAAPIAHALPEPAAVGTPKRAAGEACAQEAAGTGSSLERSELEKLAWQVRIAAHRVMHRAETTGQHEVALQVAREVVFQSGLEPGRHIYHSLLRISVKLGRPLSSLQALVNEMRQDGLQPESDTYTPLMHACANAGDFAAAHAVFVEAAAQGVAPNTFMYGHLLCSMHTDFDPDAAMAVYKEMQAHGVTADAVTYIRLFQGVRRMPHLNQDVEEGEAAGGLGAVALMHKRQLQMERATDCLALWARDAQSLGLMASSRSVLACYIRALGHTKQQEAMLSELDRAWQLLATDGRTPARTKIPNAAITELCRVGNVDAALDIARRMDTEGIPRDVHTYVSLINGCAVSRSLQQAQTLFSEVRAHCGASPPIAAYNALLKVVCMCGKLEAAVDIVCELEAVGLQPVQVTWDILLKSARQQDRHDIIAAVDLREHGETTDLSALVTAQKLATVGAGFGDESDDDILGF